MHISIASSSQMWYDQEMEKALDNYQSGDLAADFERDAHEDDDSAAKAILASGRPIHIVREDTPEGYVIRVYPDGREEVIKVDLQAAAKILGA